VNLSADINLLAYLCQLEILDQTFNSFELRSGRVLQSSLKFVWKKISFVNYLKNILQRNEHRGIFEENFVNKLNYILTLNKIILYQLRTIV